MFFFRFVKGKKGEGEDKGEGEGMGERGGWVWGLGWGLTNIEIREDSRDGDERTRKGGIKM